MGLFKSIGIAIILILLAYSLQGCKIHSDAEPKTVYGWWDANPETDVNYYEVYWWQGSDTLTASMQFVETIPHVSTADSIGSSGFLFSMPFIRLGAIAVDIDGNKSNMGLSDFYKYETFFAPSMPGNLRVEQ